MKQRSSLSGALIMGALFAATPSALAADPNSAKSASPAETTLSRPSDWQPAKGALQLRGRAQMPAGEVTTLAYPSPSLCRAQSNDPHVSTSTKTYGKAKGFSRTVCEANIPYIEVKATIWRKRWWGYQKQGTEGFGSGNNLYSIGRSGIADCISGDWRTVGYHVAQDVDFQWYSYESQKYAAVSC